MSKTYKKPNPFSQVVHALKGTGHFGEYLTEYALEHGGIEGRYAIYHNVLVPRSSGPTKTSEIDVLMLHETGVYVFESKNYDGWIFGNEEQQKWTVSYKGGHKEHFYSPIKQNRAHVRALAAHLGVPEEAFRSYIVFSERCELKAVPQDCEEYTVCKRPDLIDRLWADLASRGAEQLLDEGLFEELRERV